MSDQAAGPGTTPVFRSVARLADGRELIYFDERPRSDRDRPDQRRLPPPPPASQLRYDPLVDEWVAVAAHRQERLSPADNVTVSVRGNGTPVPAADFDVVVFERFRRSPPAACRRAPRRRPVHAAGAGWTVRGGPSPTSTTAPSPTCRSRVARCWRRSHDRTSRRPGHRPVFCFENRAWRSVTCTTTRADLRVPVHRGPASSWRRRAARRPPAAATCTRTCWRRARSRGAGGRGERALDRVRAGGVAPYEVHLAPPAGTGPARAHRRGQDAFGPLYLDLLRPSTLFERAGTHVSAWHQAPVSEGGSGHLHLQLFTIRRAPGS